MVSEKREYTAQVKNGPEIGNLISATQLTWRYEMTTHMYVDGGTNPAVVRVAGWYSWTQTDAGYAWTFEWDRTSHE